ncbi:5-methylcytosine-specific restriction endonuclease McrA [Brachybacterium sp. AG952]|uniref:hypothetical protein n=1 Tax=Brachybacterium sp. AG952 TaxID=2183989 RepID=UPI00106011D0|nr:hypothetical protein [Brachybacterium sp. AG952]TDP76335.1 5-methylcytosine-specific restriction endonuclease McrA [Brachybacterium sp. AG952]
MDERVLGVAELADADERSVNEVFGFVMRLFLQAAQQGSDYRVSFGTAMVLSPRHESLLDLAAKAGLLSVGVEDDRKVIRLVADEDFMHLRTREQIAWENQRKADTSDLTLVLPVRVRDGDACRYCGKVVSFAMRNGNRAGTYDHLIPGQRARSIDELVVACKGCNSGRRDEEGGRGSRYPLLPPPPEKQRYYSTITLAWFKDQGTVLTDLGLAIPKRPRGAKDRKPGSQTRPDAQPAPTGSARAENAATAPSGDQRTAPSQTRPADAAPHGDQRAGTARETAPSNAPQPGQPTPAGTVEEVADAAPHTSGEQRATTTSTVQAERLPAAEVASEVEQKPGPTRRDDTSASLPEAEAEGSGSAGSGRVGTGRAGQGRHGPGMDGSPPGQGGRGRRTKRGRRRRGKR